MKVPQSGPLAFVFQVLGLEAGLSQKKNHHISNDSTIATIILYIQFYNILRINVQNL